MRSKRNLFARIGAVLDKPSQSPATVLSSICLALLGCLTLARPAVGQTNSSRVSISWSSHPDAVRYIATCQLGDRPVRIRTTYSAIIVEGKGRDFSCTRVTALDANGAPLSYQSNLAVQDLPPTAAIGSVSVPNASDATPTTEPRSELDTETETPRGLKLAVDRSFVGITIGVGRERLVSTGGESKFSGTATISPISVTGLHRLLGTETPLTLAWAINAHEFAVTTEESGSGASSSEEQIKSYGRWRGEVGPRFQLWTPHQDTSPDAMRMLITWGGGLGFVKTPSLEVIDETSTSTSGTAPATLKTSTGIGPFLALHGHLFPAASTKGINAPRSGWQQLVAGIQWTPMMFGGVKQGQVATVELRWLYALTSAVDLIVGGLARQETIKADARCTATTSCSDTATTKSTTQVLHVGAGVNF